MALLRRTFLSVAAAGMVARSQARPVPLARPVRLGVIGAGNRGTSLLRVSLNFEGLSVPAVCDLDPSNISRAVDAVQSRGGARPVGFDSYERLLDRQDIDAVLIATPEQTHAEIAVAALSRGKAVLSEVAAAITMDDCWRLVETVEKTKGFYMMAENCCYYRSNLAVLAMIRAGVFGELTYADCGYIHSLPALGFRSDGSLTWRGELLRDYANWYPTHAIGPVAQWLGIHRGDRFDRIVAVASPSARLPEWARSKYGAESVAGRTRYQGDCIMAMIQTVKGKLIELRLDTVSARPTVSTTYFGVQGTKGAYRDAEGQRGIWLEADQHGERWDSFDPFEARYEDSRWARFQKEAAKTGHGGADFFTLMDFYQSVAEKKPSPIDVYDSVAWSSIIPLSTASVRDRGAWQNFPDFTRGRWRG